MSPIFSILQWLTRNSLQRFETALQNPEQAQSTLLCELVQLLQHTEYGKEHNISSIDDFHNNLPIVTYEEIEPWIERQKSSNQKILTAERPRIYEKTSGSSGPAKYIPYTKSLQRTFTRMGVLWGNDIVRYGPQLKSGKLFFSISPSFSQPEKTQTGVPIGFENDAEYISGWEYWALKPFLAIPPQISKIREPERFLFELCNALVRADKLEIISIWNPGFLLMLLDYIKENYKTLGLNTFPDFNQLWPNLKLISCWNSAQAKPLANQLSQELPNISIQGKGLLATEAPMTIPWHQAKGFVPMLDEVYFEFESTSKQILQLHQLEIGETYEIIISQKAGLSRYRIGDRIEVTHKYLDVPCFDFIGRGSSVADFVGEKLNETFVINVLDSLLPSTIGFRMLVFIRKPTSRYVLLLQECSGSKQKVCTQLENKLQQAHHYRHARLLNQLQACEVYIHPEISTAFLQYKQQRGVKLGDIKTPILYTHAIDSLSLLLSR
jgi:hypothetical protein